MILKINKMNEPEIAVWPDCLRELDRSSIIPHSCLAQLESLVKEEQKFDVQTFKIITNDVPKFTNGVN